MNEQKKLTIQMGIFAFFVIVFLGTIVFTQKAGQFFFPKIEKKIDIYINKNYKDIKNEIQKENLTYNNLTFKQKIYNKNNKNLYFYISYKKGKIKSTYKKDYLEGNTLLNNINNKLNKEIVKTTGISCKITINKKLNKYNEVVKKEIINNKDIKTIPFYTIEKEFILDNFTSKDIIYNINNILNKTTNNNINPNNYKLTFINKNKISQEIEISNFDNSLLNNKYKDYIINDIINKNNSKLLESSNIKYKYSN